MSRVVVTDNLTLDGVMQAPGRPDEDMRGDFPHGGWATPYSDAELGEVMAEGMGDAGALLLGRRTYEDFAAVWPHMPPDNPYTEVINNARKLVASRSLTAPLGWNNSSLLEGDAADAVADLRTRPGKDMVVLGSGDLVQSLMRRGLVDAFVLLIYPLVLGTGRRLFADGGPGDELRLVDTKTTKAGVLVATYHPLEGPHDAPA
jgi:dihydrofolate reductase